MPKRSRKPRRGEDVTEAASRVMREATAAHEPEPRPENPAATDSLERARQGAPARWSAPTDEEVPPPKLL